MNPGKAVLAEVRYELCLHKIFDDDGLQLFTSSQRLTMTGREVACIKRIVWNGRSIIDEKIVAVLATEKANGPNNFLDMLEFLNAGGVIGLHRDLVR